MTNDRLLVACNEAQALVKPVGRATFKLAPALKRFCTSVISKGCRRLRFDMSACTTLDSTFMGVLAGVSMWPTGSAVKIEVILTGLSPRTRSMLSTLGLERVLECHNAGERTVATDPDQAVDEVNPVLDKAETLETMRSAHQDLIRADSDNAARFCDVLTYLDQEIKRMED